DDSCVVPEGCSGHRLRIGDLRISSSQGGHVVSTRRCLGSCSGPGPAAGSKDHDVQHVRDTRSRSGSRSGIYPCRMDPARTIAFDEELCPSSLLPVRMQNKWAPLVLRLLDHGDRSFNVLRRELPRVGPKELTRALRSLERDGFVTRNPGGYRLTSLGRSLLELLLHVYAWTAAHWDEIVDARDAGSARELSHQ